AMDAIFFVRRTGCQWNALNETGIGASRSAPRRFQEWVEADVFVALWEQGLVEYDALQGIAWAWRAMAAAMTKAPLGGEKGGQESDRPRQERHQTQPPHRRPWRAHWSGRGRRQSQ